MTYEDGEVVIREGHTGNTFFLVLEGHAKAMKFNPNNGKEEEVSQYSETMYFGELSLLKDVPR